MRIAVISDIHGNLAALHAVLADLESQEVDEVLVGGDLAQGGRQPAEVLDLLIDRRWPAVVGNADALFIQVADGTHAGKAPEKSDLDPVPSARWALARLRSEHLAYLRSLPMVVRRPVPGGDFALVHATPWSVDDVVPADAPEALATRMLAQARARFVAYGHLHSAYQRVLPGGLLASVGGVSGSNDQDPRPTYTIFTFSAEVTAEVRRVEYDVDAELVALERAGYPLSEGQRRWMRLGGPWPVRAGPADPSAGSPGPNVRNERPGDTDPA